MKTKTPKEYLKDPYSISLIHDEDSGSYAAEIVEFEGCFSQGDTPDEATANVLIAAENWIEATLKQGRSIPPPYASIEASGKFALRMPVSLHDRVQRLAELDKVSLNSFLVEAIAERVGAAEYADRQMARLERRMAQQTAANLYTRILPAFARLKTKSSADADVNIEALGRYISVVENQSISSNLQIKFED